MREITAQSQPAGKWMAAAAIVPYILPAAVVGAELARAKLSEEWGLFAYFVILFGLVFASAALERKETLQRLCLAVGLLPLMRIAEIGMPIPELSDVYVTLAVAVPITIGILTVSRALDLSLPEVGLRSANLREQLIVGSTGLVFGMVGYYLIEPDGLMTGLSVGRAIVPAIVLIISQGFVTELGFRGVMQGVAEDLGGWGWVYVAALYAAFQTGELSVSYGFFMLGIALFWGWIVRVTGTIWGVALSHGIMSMLMLLILPEVMD